jgi:hypothetical protein
MASSYIEGVLALAGKRRESRVSPGAGEVVEGGGREDWADVERFQGEETGSASFGT